MTHEFECDLMEEIKDLGSQIGNRLDRIENRFESRLDILEERNLARHRELQSEVNALRMNSTAIERLFAVMESKEQTRAAELSDHNARITKLETSYNRWYGMAAAGAWLLTAIVWLVDKLREFVHVGK